MRVKATLEADLAVVVDATYVSPRTVVALPPSDIDPIWDEMRVIVGGTLISRGYDPGDAIDTGAPIYLLTEAGDSLTTEAGDLLMWEVD